MLDILNEPYRGIWEAGFQCPIEDKGSESAFSVDVCVE